jgi:hypothetical protein
MVKLKWLKNKINSMFENNCLNTKGVLISTTSIGIGAIIVFTKDTFTDQANGLLYLDLILGTHTTEYLLIICGFINLYMMLYNKLKYNFVILSLLIYSLSLIMCARLLSFEGVGYAGKMSAYLLFQTIVLTFYYLKDLSKLT